jgi:hypothetical protein
MVLVNSFIYVDDFISQVKISFVSHNQSSLYVDESHSFEWMLCTIPSIVFFVVFIPNYHPLHRTQPPRTTYDHATRGYHPPARDRDREREKEREGARAPRPACCATADDFDGREFLGAPKRCLSIPENGIDLVSGDTSVCFHNTI